MSLHKLTAGSGYDYLTRQVAVQDATEKGHTGLASYYTQRGETPGVWVGSGCASVGPGFPGSVVTQEQMQALFGAGMHPQGPEVVRQLGPDAPQPLVDAALRLGTPFRVTGTVDEFRILVARRIEDLNRSRAEKLDAPVSVDDRAAIRTEVAREVFTREFGRPPLDARELAGTIARHSRPAATAVAGFDLTFSPPKSVSTLWAVADPTVSARIEVAHQQAVQTALRFIETTLLYSREGTRGVRQVDVEGLVAASFTHRDSRAGDPDLHTHVAVANKVRTLDSGKWLSIDARVLYRGAVAASETYNTALVKLLERQGLRFEDRPSTDARKRPVREISGVSAELNTRWSSRRADIESRRTQLVSAFQRDHGRPPSVIESVKLAQQATLETREAKHEPRSLADQRAVWYRQAVEVLGGEGGLRRMLDQVVRPGRPEVEHADSGWFDQAADRVVEVMESRAATWQVHHLRAEAQRMIRRTDIPYERVGQAVDLLVSMAGDRSVSLARPDHGITEPQALRRADGFSVYTVAGSDLFTSARVLAAEQRLVELAGRADGRQTEGVHVASALDGCAADGRELNAGQAILVTAMATSGARVQLAIAPAGAGKTTAMQALTAAWTVSGGDVLGLAPSAAAAAQLREQTNTITETLAKLAWSISHHDLPDWATKVGADTLVVIDEAGMADTLSLAQVTSWAVDRGASVRLIGDDQQLAAIGAGGALRDIRATHGAVELSELMRFSDPAESAASLGLRDGTPSALGFYLDAGRVHVGDLETMTEHAFNAWHTDTTAGRDSIMLAPTRALVAELNQRARQQRLAELPAGASSGGEITLADGCTASVGDTVITRTNDRRLRISRTDWVKNGDRWTIRQLSRRGELQVAHAGIGRLVTLPREYVAASVELGYATTVHSAQGVSVDTMHGVATGEESRQQFYTMMTRGRHANHVWLQVTSDGDDHTLIRPEGISPLTPTDVLEKILGRDEAQASATSMMRDQTDPRLGLGEATQRYLDGLQVAAEHHLGRDTVTYIEGRVEHLLPGISDAHAWPTLRAHLLLLGAQGDDPLTRLESAINLRDIAGAHDIAAVLSWRLDDTGLRNAGRGPLPWLPGIPAALTDDPTFGAWLGQRHQLVTDLTDQVRQQARDATTDPGWVPAGTRRPPADVIIDVEVWRAAMQVAATDTRPTGPAQLSNAAHNWQRNLNDRIRQGVAPALAEWGDVLTSISPAIARDNFLPQLADRLAGLSRTGLDATRILQDASAQGPLPDDHAAAALWWRVVRTLPDASRERITELSPGAWVTRLPGLVGAEVAEQFTASPFWPTLVDQVDQALERGWRLDRLLAITHDTTEPDRSLALACTIAFLTHEPDADPIDHPETLPPDDLHDGWTPPTDQHESPVLDAAEAYDRLAPEDTGDVESELAVAAMLRSVMGAPEPTDADISRVLDRADAWRDCPIDRGRLIQINQLTQDFYAHRFPGSWAQQYLIDRFGADLGGHPLVQPGHAPAGWTTLVSHLRRHGVTDQEMLTAGVARVASTGRLIDQFRDRAVFPITVDGEILGFVGRRNPTIKDDGTAGPKYLNTGQTPLFHKGDQFYGTLRPGTTPVIVEGPMDAIAVTLGSGGTYTGLAPLGTSLTDQQARLLAGQPDVIIAPDADLAGHVAAERDFWQLAPYGVDPRRASFPEGTDPSDMLTTRGPRALADTLTSATPMADAMISERLTNLPITQAMDEASQVAAARPPQHWDSDTDTIAGRLGVPAPTVREAFACHVRTWNQDPRHAATQILYRSTDVRRRLEAAAHASRWTQLVNTVDPRLTRQPDWPALEHTLQQAYENGYDVDQAVRLLATPEKASSWPAADFRARFTTTLSLTPGLDVARPASASAGGDQRTLNPPPAPTRAPRR
nr:MobF family relaxase [Propionicimonas sp.]